jgi:hypothetical protein
LSFYHLYQPSYEQAILEGLEETDPLKLKPVLARLSAVAPHLPLARRLALTSSITPHHFD